MPKVLSRIADYMRSVKFYHLILGLFIFESAWIAFSAFYPQAFDESFHFGLIKVYSHYWLPFLSHQPPHADAYGAVPRDASYLYHYLMSFPYRLIALFTSSQMAQVIILRLINIALFSWGIALFRRVLLRVGTSNGLTNLILMLFILVPIVPLLASQISYDNLLLPLTGAMILLAFRVMDELRARQPSVWSISMLLGLGFLTTLVKYAFMPIFAAIVVFLAVVIAKSYRHKLKNFAHLLSASWRTQSKWAKLAMSALLVISFGMFVQRDVVNIVVYHSVEPDCSKVLSVKDCLKYSPWAYNYKDHAKVVTGAVNFDYDNPIVYGFQWLYWMWYRSFFAVSGQKKSFQNYPPLPLPSLAALVLVVAGSIALIKWWRKIFANNLYLLMLLVITAFYIVALMGHGYATYRYTAVLENMNGRYLIPVFLVAAAIIGQALNHAFKVRSRKIAFALVVLFLFLEGGGFLTFLARSDESWDVKNPTVVKINDTARKIIKPVVVKGKKTYSTKLWFFN